MLKESVQRSLESIQSFNNTQLSDMLNLSILADHSLDKGQLPFKVRTNRRDEYQGGCELLRLDRRTQVTPVSYL
jgi:hypothetical protein